MDVQYSDVRDARGSASPRADAGSADDTAYSTLLRAMRHVIGPEVSPNVLQLSPRGGLAVFSRGGRKYVFKLMCCGTTWRKRLLRWFGWNPARRAFRQSQTITRAGVPACEVVEHGSMRLPGSPRAVYTVSVFYPGAITLRAHKRELQPHRRSAIDPEIRELCTAGIRLLRQLHDTGFQHLDYHAGNLLVVPDDGDAPLRLLDLDTVVCRSPFASSRARELCRFILNFVEPQNYREVVDAALDEYADGDRALRHTMQKTRYVKQLLESKGVLKKDIVRARAAKSASLNEAG
jgi:hypothetical protein